MKKRHERITILERRERNVAGAACPLQAECCAEPPPHGLSDYINGCYAAKPARNFQDVRAAFPVFDANTRDPATLDAVLFSFERYRGTSFQSYSEVVPLEVTPRYRALACVQRSATCCSESSCNVNANFRYAGFANPELGAQMGVIGFRRNSSFFY